MSKWKVYISSTFKDLKEFRTDLINLFQNQLKNNFELCDIMERMFDDGTYTPFVDDCVDAVLESDIYIIILGNKTGSFPPNEERTYTEIELDTALSNHKRVFCLRLDNFNENEIDNKAKHNDLLNKFEGRPIHTFSDVISLKNAMYEFLIPFTAQIKEEDNVETKIKKYMEEEGFRQFLIQLAKEQNIRNYANLPPFIFGDIIKVMDVDDRNKEYEKYRTIGNDRYLLIKEYFYCYLNLCKYSVLSILWDEIRNDDIHTSKECIYKLLVNSKVDKADIDTLTKLCEEILLKFGKQKEKAFIENVMLSFDLFENGISIFTSGYPNEESYWNSEQLLNNLMTCSEFLNQYQIKSIRARYYVRHRNDDRERYTLEYSHKRNELLVVSEDEIDKKFVNIHSLYLCQKDSGEDIVINLSPFYFDKNSHDNNAAKIKLFVFDRLMEEDGEIYLNYFPVFNPRERSNETSNSNIAISKNKITTERLRDIESKEKKVKVERQLTVHKINKLYEQFLPFLKVISQEHA